MKLITAIVRPVVLDRLVVGLEEIEDFPGLTVTEASGFGQRIREGVRDTIDPFRANKRVEIVAPDEMVEQVVSVIRSCAHTGRKGDGIVLVGPLESTVLI